MEYILGVVVSQSARSAVATAWLATEHQQLMYLLSPEGKTVFYIPGVEVVHKVSTPINLPDEASKVSVSAFTGVHRLCPAQRSLLLTLGLARPASAAAAAAVVYAIAASQPQPATS